MIHIRRLSGGSVRAGVLILLMMAFFIPLRAMPGDTLLQPVRNLRIAIHVFQDDSGAGNFCKDSAGHQEFLEQLVNWVNNRLSNLDTLKPAVSSVFVGDSRVQIRLDTLFYHHDTRAWDCSSEIDSPYMREQYVDSDTSLSYLLKYQTLPVFIGANHGVTGGHTRNLADRGYIAVRGYYESFLSHHLSESLDECGRNLVHELCHCLGLSHNFTGGADGEQCDACGDNGCPIQGTSNNIMDYWPSYGYALSKCQFDEIHFCLNGGRGNISEIVINDSCYRVSRSVYRVSEGETLAVNDTTYFHNDILVENGGALKVTGYLSMPGETNITVEAGGSLEINGGTIGNLCGDLWTGICIKKEDSATPAKIMIVNAGFVEHARLGLFASGPVNALLNNAGFRNCGESAAFLKGSADSVLVNNCVFSVTNKLNHYEEGITPGVFLRADSIQRLVVTGSRFINEPGTYIFDADWLGTGIEAGCPSVKVDHCEFINLTNGISLFWGNQESKYEVSENRFANNRYGVKSGFAGIQCITANSVTLQRLNTGSSIGVLLNNPDKYVISGNQFKSVYGGGKLAGIVLHEPGYETAPVFGNTFSNLPVGVFTDKVPSVDSVLFRWAQGFLHEDSLKLGPQFRFNRFDTVGIYLALVRDSAYGSAMGPASDVSKKSLMSSRYWNPGGYAWYNEQMQMLAFHGWKSLPVLKPDHGLYWFMNYPGVIDSVNQGIIRLGYGSLKEYLLNIKLIEDSVDNFNRAGVYPELSLMSNIPAAARSGIIAGYWSEHQSETQAWLDESLASIAGRFVRSDSLLTGLGTENAIQNRILWTRFFPGRMNLLAPTKSVDLSGYDLPDIDAFRFIQSQLGQSVEPAFTLYPNPTNEYVFIQPRAGYTFEHPWEGTIISADGHHQKSVRIESWEQQKITVSDLPAGVYVMEFYSENQYLGAVKFVKTKRSS